MKTDVPNKSLGFLSTMSQIAVESPCGCPGVSDPPAIAGIPGPYGNARMPPMPSSRDCEPDPSRLRDSNCMYNFNGTPAHETSLSSLHPLRCSIHPQPPALERRHPLKLRPFDPADELTSSVRIAIRTHCDLSEKEIDCDSLN